MILRDYQSEGADCVTRQLTNGTRSTLVEWATGCGKTVLAAEIIKRFYPQQSLFICNSIELVDQAADKIFRHTGLKCRIERSQHKIHPDELFKSTLPIVSTVQSLNGAWGQARRMHKFKPKLVIFDEADMAIADTFERVNNYVGDECKIMGITATPLRHDKRALGRIFQEVAHRYPLEQAVADGYLVDIAARSVTVHGLDYSKLKVVKGDYTTAQLKELLEPEEIIQRMVQGSLEMVYGVEPKEVLGLVEPHLWNDILHGRSPFPFPVNGKTVEVQVPMGRKAIMFCSSVNHAQMACDIFNRVLHGEADWISGETSDIDREKKIDAFRSGRTRIMCNCGVFCRGFDEPTVEMVLMGRPTASATLIKQQIGRVTRTLEGVIDGLDTKEKRLAAIENSPKPKARVVDYVGNTEHPDMKSVVDILGGDYSDQVKKKTKERMLKKGVMVSVALSLMEAEEKKELALRKEQQEKFDAERKKGLVAASHYSTKEVDLFGKKSNKPKQWHPTARTGKPATERQLAALASLGIHPKAGWTLAQASMFIADARKNEEAGRGWRLSPQHEWAKNRRPR